MSKLALQIAGMKKLLLIVLSVFFYLSADATHIIGGEMTYEYLGEGVAPNSKRYRIRLILFRGPTGAALINQYVVGVYNNDNNAKVIGTADNQNWFAVNDFVTPLPVPINIDPCISLAPTLNYTYKTYSFEIELPNNNNGYTVAFQTFSRQNSNSITNDTGANYYTVIPGTNQLSAAQNDNSPRFGLPISVICNNAPFTLDFSATDADGDSLVYYFCNALNGGPADQADFRNTQAPPYNSVSYITPYSGTQPLGSQATINSSTGIISGTAPGPGKYVICVCVDVYRNGVRIGTHRKDLIVEVSGCIATNAVPDPGYTTCDGFNIQFDHNSSGANSVFWDFGDGTTLDDTSRLDNPVYVYTDTGRYTVKFIINRGESCSDSSEIVMGVYPGFFPGYEAAAPYCTGVPVQFSDTTFTQYGVVDSWRWNFGDNSSPNNTSDQKNPQHIYNTPGTYNVQLIVTNSKGCVDTVRKSIQILPSPVLTMVSADTAYCGLDTLQLTATGTGNFSWSPLTRISGANTATPRVSPNTPTTYIVSLEQQGCISRDSVRLTPLFDLSNSITATPAEICQFDTLTLRGSSNKTNVRWLWGPASTLQSPNTVQTRAYPLSNTQYSLTTFWGDHCSVTETIDIPVTPLAQTQAGIDTAYCISGPGVTLQASGGDTYRWTPTTGLSNANISNPVASPPVTSTYVVQVGVQGCARTVPDTIVVIARPKPNLELIEDTLICIIDTVQINPVGTGSYSWSPNYMIHSLTSPNPLFSPDVPTRYYVRMTDIYGCFREDSVFIDVRPDVTVDAGADTTICLGDTFTIPTTGDAISHEWTPPDGLNDVTLRNPVANPATTTRYVVRANIGKCEKQSDILVKVVPYPAARAIGDTILCIGKNTALQASGGSLYEWTPSTFLSNPMVANPQVIQPQQTTRYIVTVRDTLGCPKGVSDTVTVRVEPLPNVRINMQDTSIVRGQPLRIPASGAATYLWTPSIWLSSPTVSAPTALPQDDIVYTVTGTSAFGCQARDSIEITLYDVYPGMFVPTAFTPNGDGLNDVIRPILLGMKELKHFRIYNRYGQLVFETSQQGKGWDGIFEGKPQDTGTFVWMAEGVTYSGQIRQQKGTVILIR